MAGGHRRAGDRGARGQRPSSSARGLTERIPVTDAEVAEASAEPRADAADGPGRLGTLKAEQTARVQADREAEAERMARLTPVTDAELERYGADAEAEPEAESAAAESGQDRSEVLAGLREDVGALGAKVDELARQDAERAAERAEMDSGGH